MNKDIPVPALAVSYIGAIASMVAEAKSMIGALAALASLIASLYAIAVSRRRLRKLKRPDPNPFRGSTPRSPRPPRFKKPVARAARTFVILVTFCLISGCATKSNGRARAEKTLTASNENLTEQSRALTTGALDALSVAPENPPTNLARKLVKADQSIEGIPLQRLPVTEALAGNTNAAAEIDARLQNIETLRTENAHLSQALRDREDALIHLGEKYEAEKNKTLWRRIKTWIAGTLGLGGLIVLCIACPAAIPILTRGLAWIIRKVPQLAGALGVVGKDAFDAVVKAVGHTRDQLKSTNSDTLHALDSNLKAETDADHKALINQRRAALNL